ncbi:MAG: ParB/RepB/Spo0J family partition protein [Candidatus Thiodiazotropha endolucinida]|nr:ParB/RepB/Spo0J family partition protein [Candidatus Thiodiazotropha taylori]MCW4225216.1 ParB/RepB/Spo0J family partition protein [Candidatus Thiodiazotropha endolucinida]MCG7880768.1 ParB/RepB/Spo0J family partition protein [Candidatus Thiodiazotropha taylori]MCG7886787.1 ParB/RepB/Spo0J family partition protein [Candidatus Thiodiazotropha taylori]MCG8028174.1 ParB/RepB/Spo0J family partition protein [Candidatus Thiodiazotropha taylori]
MEDSQKTYEKLLPRQIIPDPDQPRKDFDEKKLMDLADNIKAVGIIQPITVRRLAESDRQHMDAEFMIIAGERRFQAACRAGLKEIPCIIDESAAKTDKIFTYQLTENFHRENLNSVEKAEFLQKRIDHLKSTGVLNAVETVANELGVSKGWISKNTAVLKYPDCIRAIARNGLVKDYSLLNKLHSLSTDKQKQAIDKIKDGTFNKKEFFARKRYDKPKEQQTNEKSPVDKKPKKHINLKLTSNEFFRLINKTDYIHILKNVDPDWNEQTHLNQAHDLVEPFKEWLIDVNTDS